MKRTGLCAWKKSRRKPVQKRVKTEVGRPGFPRGGRFSLAREPAILIFRRKHSPREKRQRTGMRQQCAAALSHKGAESCVTDVHGESSLEQARQAHYWLERPLRMPGRLRYQLPGRGANHAFASSLRAIPGRPIVTGAPIPAKSKPCGPVLPKPRQNWATLNC